MMYTKDKQSGLFYRAGTYDINIIREARTSYKHFVLANAVVMDIGGCFGAFAVPAVNAGARSVIVYEPDPENFKLLRKNTIRFRKYLVLHNAAVVAKTRPVWLYKAQRGVNNGSHSITEFRGRDRIRVNTVLFREELQKYQPTIIKMDCEGAEYELLVDDLPHYIKQIAVELHLNRQQWRGAGPLLAARLDKQFNKQLKRPVFTGRNWHTVGVWSR